MYSLFFEIISSALQAVTQKNEIILTGSFTSTAFKLKDLIFLQQFFIRKNLPSYERGGSVSFPHDRISVLLFFIFYTILPPVSIHNYILN